MASSNVAKLLRYCFTRRLGAIMHIFVVTDGRPQICRLLCNKSITKLKYNFSGRVSLLQVATVTGISTNWVVNVQRFEL